MKRTMIVVAAVLGFATAASAATLSVTPDKATYSIGETITLSVSGDSQGAADNAIFGRLLYSSALTDTVSASQNQLTSLSGAIPWIVGANAVSDGQADVINQINGAGAFTVDQLFAGTATLVAEAAGVVNVTWKTSGGTPASNLDFFGLTSAAGTSFTIVPEPTTAAMLGLGLLGLALTGRRRD